MRRPTRDFARHMSKCHEIRIKNLILKEKRDNACHHKLFMHIRNKDNHFDCKSCHVVFMLLLFLVSIRYEHRPVGEMNQELIFVIRKTLLQFLGS